jgi:hypothetical protein
MSELVTKSRASRRRYREKTRVSPPPPVVAEAEVETTEVEKKKNKKRREWPAITSTYGEWVDYFPRLKYIFDSTNKFQSIYEKYGYNSVRPELDHRTVSYDERIEIYKAKTCFKRREEYLTATNALQDAIEIRKSIVDAAFAEWVHEKSIKEAKDEAILKKAQALGDALVQEVNAFLLWSMPVNAKSPCSGGFSFFHPESENTVYAWRNGSKEVNLEMSDKDEKVIVTDKKKIFKFMKHSTKLMHELFYARTRKEVLYALQGFLSDGWIVYL